MTLNAGDQCDVSVLTRTVHRALSRLVVVLHVLREVLFDRAPPRLCRLVDVRHLLIVARFFPQVVVASNKKNKYRSRNINLKVFWKIDDFIYRKDFFVLGS